LFQDLTESQKKRNNLYIKHLPDTNDEEALKKQLDELFGQFGEIEQMLVRKDEKIQRYFSFLCYKESESAQKAVEHFHANPQSPFGEIPLYVNFSQTRQERDDELRKRRAEASNQNNLYIKNLKEDTTRDQVKDLFSQYGEIISCDVKRWDHPNNTKKVQYGFVAFKTPDEAAKAMNASHESEQVKKLFVEERPIVNIFQNKDQRSKFLQTQHRARYTAPNFAPFGANPEMQRNIFNPTRKFPSIFPPNPYMGNPMQGGAAPGQQMRSGLPMNKKPYQTRGPPFMGGGNRQGMRPQGGMNQGGFRGGDNPNISRNRQQDQNPSASFNRGPQDQNRGHRPPHQNKPDNSFPAPKQTSFGELKSTQPGGQPPASTITVADLKNKWSEFIKLDKEKQRNILGELLFPMIKDRVGESLAPKITGMLIDLDVLEIAEIFEFLEDRDLLHERVEEAKILILSEQA